MTPFSTGVDADRDLEVLDLQAARSSDRSFQADGEQILRLDRELHRQLLEHGLAEAADDHVHGILAVDAALQAVEELVVADLRGARLVLDGRARILGLDVREGVRAAVARPSAANRTG